MILAEVVLPSKTDVPFKETLFSATILPLISPSNTTSLLFTSPCKLVVPKILTIPLQPTFPTIVASIVVNELALIFPLTFPLIVTLLSQLILPSTLPSICKSALQVISPFIFVPLEITVGAYSGSTLGCFAKEEIKKIDITLPAYISIDKDVLNHYHARTNWDQGNMSVYTLKKLLEEVFKHQEVIGIDICGECNLQEPLQQLIEDEKINHITNDILYHFLSRYIS